MTTDNRMNEPSEAQIEAAAKALHETRNPWFAAYGDWGAAGYEIKQAFRESARAALEAAARAAQGAAPQAESEDNVMCRCGHGTGSHDFSDPQESCREIVCDCRGWFGVSPVLPSSGVGEVWSGQIVTAAFENGEGGFDCGLEDCECPEHEQPPIPAGTYITVRLDRDERVGLADVEIRVLAGKEKNNEHTSNQRGDPKTGTSANGASTYGGGYSAG